MKKISLLLIFTYLANLGFAQTNNRLYFFKPLPAGPSTLVFEIDSTCTDTVLITGAFNNLLDYKIKSENEIAILLKGVDIYSYFQFNKSENYQFWSSDSAVVWAGPSYDYENPNSLEYKAKYQLRDFYTVIKVLDGDTIVINLQAQKSDRAQPPMQEKELSFVIQKLSEDPKKDWTALDSVFRNHVLRTSSERLRHLSFILMILHKEFLEKADTSTLNFYAKELEKMEYRGDIKFHMLLIKKLSAFWPPNQMAEYARNLYEKNNKYWMSKFRRPYWKDNESELKELKRLMRKGKIYRLSFIRQIE